MAGVRAREVSSLRTFYTRRDFGDVAMGVSTSSGRSLLLPESALPKTSAMATLKKDEAA